MAGSVLGVQRGALDPPPCPVGCEVGDDGVGDERRAHPPRVGEQSVADVAGAVRRRESLLQRPCDRRESAYPMLPVKLWGLEFPNPVGLAAGMDKHAAAVPAWAAAGLDDEAVAAALAVIYQHLAGRRIS